MAEPEKQLVRIWKIVDATEFDISVEVGFLSCYILNICANPLVLLYIQKGS